ncbi:head maturation protease, ClpP-related [Blastococcus sp. CT_GayMR16]|uniref:head maturation protease, ClpP-related n=1 Tax=Blastococcus sp. CT_GayMR16 TaxID=2559607 RepID=UPI0010744B07|nr:head maturation protease, ClpP-related [Blastococcus sp. CT_GayMR16]TFV90400.1 hypothetical protein E4P38_02870 [Blastococcus sp. CT_GayMR16]
MPALADLPVEQPREWFHIGPARAEVVGDQSGGENSERKTADVYIFDAIGGWSGTTATSFVRDVAALDVDHIDLHLNSPGGNAMDGVAIANVLRQHRAEVTVWVDGMAASAASVIAMAGDEVVMGIGSQMMIHDASGYAFGPASEMRKAAEMLDSTSNAYASAYAAKAGGTSAEWRGVMVEETWYTGEEAVAAKLADRIATAEDNGRASGEQVVPGSSTPSFWDMWDQLASADRHTETVRKLFAYAGRAEAPPPRLPGGADLVVQGRLVTALTGARREMSSEGLLHVAPDGKRMSYAASPQTPAASASGSTHKERSTPVPFTDEQLATMRTTLGLAADASEDQIVSTVAEIKKDSAKEPNAALPEGAVAIDSGVLEQLRTDAASGRAAREQQQAERREQMVNAAISEGRTTPAAKAAWLNKLQVEGEVAEQQLASLAKGLVPVAELGHDQQPAAQEDLGWFGAVSTTTSREG